MTDSVAHTSAKAREPGWAAEQWRHFLDDVIRRPTIGPVASWLILGLVTLVGWLTAQYAPGAATGAACGASAQQAAGDAGVIPVNAGYGTVIAVMAITLIAGMQPVLEKRFTSDWSGQLGDWFARQSWVVRAPVIFATRVLGGLFQIPSWLLSFADYLLARPIALIAGAGLSPFWLRYGVFLFWMGAAIAAAWMLREPWGLCGFFAGVTLIIGVVGRWNWVEADREAFFVARRQRKQIERIGFAEDLRDEALVALVFLFVLIPLGLRQVELMAPETFCINGASGADAGVLDWLGFFGAELAKSVPFVDWSEVFHVANGSPIEPRTVLGAQVVFAMRATLDLLMIAAVVQAVQLASRLAQQNAAFAAGDIDILEPFGERQRFHRLGAAIDRAGDGKVIDQPALREFPLYSPERLKQIVDGASAPKPVQAQIDPAARRAAMALVARQRPLEEAKLIIGCAKSDRVDANKRLAIRLAFEVEPGDIMQRAFARANEVKTAQGTIDVTTLSEEFEAFERTSALRAIRHVAGGLDVMVPIPAGEFMMGDEEEPSEQRRVSVTAFAMGKYPVTFEEFDAFCEVTGYWRRQLRADEALPPDQGWGRERRPAINLSWYDAKAYVDWLNSWTAGGFRLPTEAEWEYACRAGTTTAYSFDGGVERLGEYAWFERNAEGMTHPVGEKLPNPWGLYDMHGNVAEWVEDAQSPEGPSYRVLRGGSWYFSPGLLRSALGIRYFPSYRDINFGFRLARTL